MTSCVSSWWTNVSNVFMLVQCMIRSIYFVIVIIITEIGIVTNNSTFIKLCMCICALHRSSCDEIFIVSVVFDNNCWTAPWWWAEVRNSESPERAASVFAFLFVCLSVCLFVCLLTRYKSQFSTLQPNFLKICSLGLWEKSIFSVFRNFHFWRF